MDVVRRQFFVERVKLALGAGFVADAESTSPERNRSEVSVSESPSSDWTWINAAADRFERAWKQGPRPRIEDHLAEVEESQRPALLEELLRVELELRRRDGEEPDPEDYAARFPHDIRDRRSCPRPRAGPIRLSAAGGTTCRRSHRITTAGQTGPNGEPAPGDRVRYFGDYEITREIARGGMGVVFRARQISLNRTVALKMILAGQLADETDVKRFYTEAEAAAQARPSGDRADLRGWAARGAAFLLDGVRRGAEPRRAAGRGTDAGPRGGRALLEVAKAIEYAHRRGVIHRDLKPANILFDADGNPRVTDFGLAKRVQADSGLTGSGQIMGTPSYMPPEQAGGKRGEVGPAADVYALGATLYCMMTGRPPFQAATAMDTLLQVIGEEPVPPRRLNAAVPRDLETICLKCLQKEPHRRYTSAQALADDLQAWLGGRPIAARPVGALERAGMFVRRHPSLAAAYGLAAAVLVLAGFGGIVVHFWREAVVARKQAERARDGETKARALAEEARDGEATARAEVERQRERVERIDYGRTIEVAHQEWREANVAAALALLDSTRADLRGWEWRYVHRLCHSELMTLKGHTDSVYSVAFSPDGSRIVTGSWDKTAKVWDARSGAEVLTLKGHTDRVGSAAFSPDGSRIVTGSLDGTTKVWDAWSGAEVLTLRHTGLGGSAGVQPRRVAHRHRRGS